MSEISRPIVVGVDESPASLGVLRWAANEAVRHARALRVVHALEHSEPPASQADQQRIALDAAIEARLLAPGIEVTTTTALGPPAEMLREQSRWASMIVIGGSGHHGLVFGSIGERLAACAECPVLVVPNGERWAGPEVHLPTSAPIVVGDDGSAAARHALGLAFTEAATHGVPLVPVRVWQRPGEHHHWPRVDVAAEGRAVQQAFTTDLRPWLAKFPEVEVQPMLREGGTADELIDASGGALMIVLGARGHGGFDELRIGAVTRQVLHRATCAVLVDRTP
jgi:nucleotide-binding universal stress UspA family protein